MKWKKAVSLLLMAGLTFAFYSWYEYPVKNTEEDIKEALVEWEARDPDSPEPKLMDILQLGKSDTYAIFYLKGEDTAVAFLKEGISGRLKLVRSSSGNSDASYDSTETSKGSYGIVRGKNTDGRVQAVKVELQNAPFSFEEQVSPGPYYFLVQKLPEEINEQTFADITLIDDTNTPFDPN
ncbi:hypothetical protein [Domibacillus enclensis]|nr:hypothetical protein [Domibacillus enclensis]SIR07697.1 hypothetical protein SAMN05443094_105101 [Domibacillus enclensis]